MEAPVFLRRLGRIPGVLRSATTFATVLAGTARVSGRQLQVLQRSRSVMPDQEAAASGPSMPRQDSPDIPRLSGALRAESPSQVAADRETKASSDNQMSNRSANLALRWAPAQWCGGFRVPLGSVLAGPPIDTRPSGAVSERYGPARSSASLATRPGRCVSSLFQQPQDHP